MNYIAVIPARKGSKSIKNKNIVKINKKPLVEYTFEAIKKSSLSCEKSFVLTNDDRVKKIANNYKINSQYKRPEKTSGSKTSLLQTLTDFLNWTEKMSIEYEYIFVLQPTSPLRTHKDINSSLKKTFKKNFSCLVSLSSSLEHPYETVFLNDKNKIKFFFKKSLKYTRRQDFDHESYFINGAIYITSKNL